MPETLTKVLFVRVDAETHARLVRAADAASMGLAEWARAELTRAAMRRTDKARKPGRK